MDARVIDWYYSCMALRKSIPTFALLGETEMFPDVVHCENITDRAPTHGWTIPPHRHALMAQLFLIGEGCVTGRLDGDDLRLQAAEWVFIPAQTVHSFVFAPQTTGLVLSFPTAVVASIGPAQPEIARALATAFTGPVTQRLLALTGTLSEVLTEAGIFRAQVAVGLAHAVLALLARTRQESGVSRPDPRLARLDGLIAENIARGWGAGEYAAAMAMTTGHLGRLCRAAKGVSTSAYIEAVVMQEASRLLAFTQIAAADVGFRLGYNDPSYFSRRFRAAHGMSPSDYRRQFVS